MDQTVTEELKQDIKKQDQEKVKQEDFKMVTFTLAGRDYALDIMKVKEISKANKFTYVPNSAPYVRGVYNLRGDIISVIDLRIFFNQFDRDKQSNAANELENMIILRLEDHVIAVIVETIEKVVGVFKDEIQPPHPLFGDINIKYINGVVEKNERLYVILDVEKIFNSRDTPEIKVNIPKAKVVAKIDVETPLPTTSSSADFAAKDDINLKFISETLATFKVFYPSEINQKWLKNRFKDWANIRNKSGKDVQFSSEDEAKAFIKGFYSPYPNTLWDKTYADIIAGFIDKNKTGNFTVWNPGCGKGSETYSLSVMLKEHNSKLLLKILANDNDLISISTAPGLIIPSDKLDSTYKKYTVEGSNGVQFNKEIKSSIIFEYHDVMHENNLPALDMVVMRDILSFVPVEMQGKLLQDVEENLRPGGILLLGQNESIDGRTNWKMEEKDNIKIYRKK